MRKKNSRSNHFIVYILNLDKEPYSKDLRKVVFKIGTNRFDHFRLDLYSEQARRRVHSLLSPKYCEDNDRVIHIEEVDDFAIL